MKLLISLLLLGIIIISGCVEEIVEEPIKEISEEKLYDIFYDSQCYKDNKEEFGISNISFKIEQFKNVKIKRIDKFSRGNLTYVDIHFQELGDVGDSLMTSYDIIETDNVIVWRVQGGIFSDAYAGSFHGCLVFIDANSSKILVEGWYQYW